MESPHSDSESYKRHTRQWIEQVVIGLQFCPFAAQPFRNEAIRYVVLENATIAETLERMMQELWHLDQHAETETTLIILPDAFADFMDYLDLLDLAEVLIEDQEYEGIYQVASFHPDYQFEEHTLEDAANYTNRSPYPMLHLLREDSITKALEHYADPEEIPLCNKAVAREKGILAMRVLREACMK